MILFGKILKYSFILLLLGATLGVLLIGGTYLHFRSELPSIDNLRQIQLQVPMRVFSADDKLIAQYGEKRRDPVSYDEIPDDLIHAFLAAEDQNFFRHYGIDPAGLARAAVTLVLTGKKRQGGSTITMQVARNYYLTRKRTFTRKIREIFLALHIEQELSKKEILELYLNKIYLGHRSYGIKAAAQVYYGKSLDEL
ncbi:MAG TPA: peptidase, partial [Chromatiaceae bacterium]|nr:peptidase [Chromatiaceae bacterium]